MSEFWSGRPVLLTGACGFVGSWLLGRLLDDGADVVCIVRDRVPAALANRAGLLDRSVVVYGDVCDQALVERTLGEYEINSVFHLAAQTIVPIAERNPISTFDSNIRGTWTVLEAIRRSPVVQQVVVASSDKAYGEGDQLPFSEDTPLQGRYPYDVSKACADLLAQSYARTWRTPVAISRCGNFYGGGDLNWSRLVPGTVRAALGGRRPTIRSDGSLVRDYFYVEDGAAAYMQLAERLAEDRDLIGEAFNFSGDEQLNVLDMTARILDSLGSSLEPVIENGPGGEIERQYLDAGRARRILGWEPRFDLRTGLALTVDWYRDFFAERSL